jgi:hypothetical protein
MPTYSAFPSLKPALPTRLQEPFANFITVARSFGVVVRSAKAT